MAWWEWLLLVLVVLVLVSTAAYLVVRSTVRGRAFFALPTRGKLRFGRALLLDRELPLYTRGIIVLLVAYLALPFDIVPDFLPVIGQLDDVAIVIMTIALLLILVPGDRFDAALRAGADPPESGARKEAVRADKSG